MKVHVTNTRKTGTRVAGDECSEPPGATTYPAGGSLHSSPATQYVLLTFGLQLVRVKSKQLSSSGVSELTYMTVLPEQLRKMNHDIIRTTDTLRSTPDERNKRETQR
uniref:Uncharacterized protein n=1 Tax=Candidatus Kentrum sp. DK TaxID=2126562 RepID=A0A450SCH5_9GAMM|nr:MAG: hypothetical protein BECKDK2373C_GA0170839_10285 [Candidatus Kentron sp. DK]